MVALAELPFSSLHIWGGAAPSPELKARNNRVLRPTKQTDRKAAEENSTEDDLHCKKNRENSLLIVPYPLNLEHPKTETKVTFQLFSQVTQDFTHVAKLASNFASGESEIYKINVHSFRGSECSDLLRPASQHQE